MPFLIPAAVIAWAVTEWNNPPWANTQSSPSTAGAVPTPSGAPSPYTMAVYGAMGLGLYWLYRKAKHA